MKDCFAYGDYFLSGKKFNCGILKSGICGGKCSFYKTEKQFEADRAVSFAKIAAMPEERQEYIAHAYYYGMMPWKKGGRRQ